MENRKGYAIVFYKVSEGDFKDSLPEDIKDGSKGLAVWIAEENYEGGTLQEQGDQLARVIERWKGDYLNKKDNNV